MTRRDIVLEIQVPEHGEGLLEPWGGVIPSDQSMVLTEIIVPPVPHADEDVFELIVGDKVDVRMPLKFFTDSYRAALSGMPSLLTSKREEFDHILRRVFIDLEERANSFEYDPSVAAKELAVALHALQHRSFLGVYLNPPVLILPRMNFSVRTQGRSQPLVWLRGILSRDVA